MLFYYIHVMPEVSELFFSNCSFLSFQFRFLGFYRKMSYLIVHNAQKPTLLIARFKQMGEMQESWKFFEKKLLTFF